MHLKTHFKVLFHSSKISKTCAHLIFLLNTRHDQEHNKIGSTQFGSTKLELHIFESCTQFCEKQNKQNQKQEINFATGPARTDPAAREFALARPKTRRSPACSRRARQRLTGWTRASAREAGDGGRRRRDSPSVASPARPTVPTGLPHPSGPRGTLIRSY